MTASDSLPPHTPYNSSCKDSEDRCQATSCLQLSLLIPVGLLFEAKALKCARTFIHEPFTLWLKPNMLSQIRYKIKFVLQSIFLRHTLSYLTFWKNSKPHPNKLLYVQLMICWLKGAWGHAVLASKAWLNAHCRFPWSGLLNALCCQHIYICVFIVQTNSEGGTFS